MKERDKRIICKQYLWPHNRIVKGMKDISFDSDDVIEHVNTFFDSLSHIDSEYFVYDLDEEKVKLLDSNAQTEAIKHTERVFAYELYHQWSCNLYRLDIKNEWKLNGELFKHLEWFYSKREGTEVPKKSGNAYPDMVLHRGQNADDQMIVCEIKRDYRLDRDIINDITRLYTFTRNNDAVNAFKPYKCGIFLAINADVQLLLGSIYHHKRKLKSIIGDSSGNNIICISCTKDKVISFQSLGEILRQIQIEPKKAEKPSRYIASLPKKVKGMKNLRNSK